MICEDTHYSYVRILLVKSCPSEENTRSRAPNTNVSFSGAPGTLGNISLMLLRLGPALISQRVAEDLAVARRI